MAVFIALMRGINVGGRHKLPMATLRSVFADAGASEIQTYIQSGNIVFEAGARSGKRIANAVAAAVEAQLGWAAPVVLRTAGAFCEAVELCPYGDAAEPKLVHGVFFDRPTSAADRAAFAPPLTQDEVYELHPEMLFVHYRGGSARSKLTVDVIDRALNVRSTGRNLRTMLKLAELARG